MVGLVVETPLAKHHIGTGILHALNHVREVVLLHLLEFLVVCDRLDLNSVLRLGLWWFEGAGEDADTSILGFFTHLGVREVLVYYDALNELGVLDGAARLGNNLNQVEVHVTPLQICHVQYRAHCEVSKVLLALAYYLGAQGRGGALPQEIVVVFANIELFRDLVKAACCNFTSLLEPVRNFERVNSLVKKLLCLLEDRAREHDHSCGSIANFIILRR